MTISRASYALRSPLLDAHGFAHGFSTRLGGVSAPPRDAMNLGRGVGDDPSAVAENHRRLALAIGYDVERLFETSQVHGAAVRVVGEHDLVLELRGVEADALVACARGIAIGVRTADCMPVLLADPDTGAVAAIHAGWRGVVRGVVAAGVAALTEYGRGSPARWIAAIGPHIRAASFEVGDDVARSIAAVSCGVDVVVPSAPRPRVDLVKSVIAQLEVHGITKDRIDDVGGDTFAEPARFHSHRRDADRSGRHLSVIVAR